MAANVRTLIDKLQSLPPERLAEVEDFVDFLNSKSRRLAALERLLAVAPAIEDAGAEPITDEAIQEEVDRARVDRRDRQNRRAVAPRS